MAKVVDKDYSFLGEVLEVYLEVEGRIHMLTTIIIKVDIPTTKDRWEVVA
jgi:hypothetical protein